MVCSINSSYVVRVALSFLFLVFSFLSFHLLCIRNLRNYSWECILQRRQPELTSTCFLSVDLGSKKSVCLALNYFLSNFNFVHYQLTVSLSSFFPAVVGVNSPKAREKIWVKLWLRKTNHMHERFWPNKITKNPGPWRKGFFFRSQGFTYFFVLISTKAFFPFRWQHFG